MNYYERAKAFNIASGTIWKHCDDFSVIVLYTDIECVDYSFWHVIKFKDDTITHLYWYLPYIIGLVLRKQIVAIN